MSSKTVKIGGVTLPVFDCPPEWQHLIPEAEPYEAQGEEETAVALGAKFHRPVLIEGPAGSGKNALLRSVAHRLRRPLVTISIAEGTGVETFVGMPVPVSGPKGIAVEFRDGALPLMMRAGGWLVCDEVNMGDERVLARMHDVLANGWKLAIPEDPNNPARMVTPFEGGYHNGFMLFGTGNPHDSGKYSGTKELNTAFRDRFLHVFVDYIGLIDPAAEVRALVAHTGIKPGKAERIVKVFNTIRKKSRMSDEQMRKSGTAPIYAEASTRSAIDVAQLSDDVPIMRAFELGFLNKVNQSDRLVIHKLVLDEFAADGATG